ncbi:hypothetical protein ACH4S8_37905 [Streptomyces sp. NPDC021080]|uniref:hypothetical protein n=1 Tax=Streptomyces sp. NPDC021080 TaxID=3365110 RepID=UPI0037A896C9
MTDEPIYYRVHGDTDLSDYLNGFNDDEVVYAITDKAVDPMDTGDDWYAEEAARASKDEHTVWAKAYETFTSEVNRATSNLEAARAAWEKAQAVHSAALEDAWNDYAPTDTAVTARRDEVREMRREAEKEKVQVEIRAAQEAQDREDAELGPRTWVAFHPNLRSHKVSPDMMVPVIHVAGCKVTKGGEHLPYGNEYRYERKPEVEGTLLAGAPRYERGRATSDRLPTKLCGRCKPHSSLHAALGEVYEGWLAGVESIQEPMPTTAGVPAALKLSDEWCSRTSPGFTVQSAKYYLEEKLVEPYEVMISWILPDAKTVTANPEKLAYLEQVLPGRGFAVRRVQEPKIYRNPDGTMCETAVVVRRMTKAEIRQRKQDAAETARFQTAPQAPQNLEN